MKQLNWYQIFGNTHKIPDGRTVTPTDDIQIWLHCADIWDKSYTTLYEVLNDTATLSALMASDNAVDYLVRSTSWAVPITVPIMTSNTTPSGACFGVNGDSGTDYYPYKAFDGNAAFETSHFFRTTTTANAGAVGYMFTEAIQICKWYATVRNNTASSNPTTLVLEGSNDGIEWTQIGDAVSKTLTSGEIYTLGDTVTADESYLYFRVRRTLGADRLVVLEANFYSASVTTDSNAMTYIGQNNYCANTLLADSAWCEAICNSEYFESVLNVKVPAMTSNTTPEGVASTDSIFATNYDAWKAFNGIDNINYGWCAADGNPHWVQYEFTEPVCVKKILYRGFQYRPEDKAVLCGSNNNIDYTDLLNIPSPVSQTSDIMTALVENNTSEKYKTIRVQNVTANSSGYRFQFYGRKDV